MLRVQPVIRLSNLDDATTAPERQLDQITHAAKARDLDAVILPAVEDLDVSGRISPFRRPGLGPVLADPALYGQFDALYVAKLDRLTRNLGDFAELVKWCRKHGKTLASVAEALDLESPAGRLAADILVRFAQFEAERASERRAEAALTLRNRGLWNGGSVPYGYRPTRADDGIHWTLEPDPAQAAVIRRMVAMILDDISASAVARALNADHVPTAQDDQRRRSGKPPRGNVWSTSAVLGILRNPALIGQSRDNDGRLYRDGSGLPITREPILDAETWQRLQHFLDAYATRREGGRKARALLSGVATCAHCDAPLYSTQTFTVGANGARRPYHYYRCAAKCADSRMVRMALLDDAVTDALLTAYADEDVPEKVEIPASDNTARLAEVGELIAGLDVEYRAARLPAAVYARQVAALDAERETLAAEPPRPARIELRRSGVTFAQDWQARDTANRNALLRKLGARIVYGDGMLVANLRTLDDLRRAAAS
jgi:DNA invertase Pin-like site-specific DNA recombinase